MSETQKISERVKIARKKKGLTQGELAEKTGVTQGFLSHIEKDKNQPTAEFIIRLTHILGISAHWLLTGEGEMRLGTVEKGHGFTAEQAPGWLTDDEQRLLDAWHHASEEIRRAALTMLENSAKEFQAGGGEGGSSPAQSSA